jgi:hypothetical protein
MPDEETGIREAAATKDTAPSDAQDDREAGAETAARLYLDLWERNVVHAALKGPLPVRSGR